MLSKFLTLCGKTSSILLSGLCLAISLVLLLTHSVFPLDPAWVTLIICGTPIFFGAGRHLFRQHRISSDLLITIAVISSLLLGEIFAAGEIVFIMALGELLEDRTVQRAKKGLQQLIKLVPQQGRIVRNQQQTEMVAVEQLRLQDIIRVLPGEVIPVDGKIVNGNTSVDQSIMTGESLPVDKTIDDEVFAGTLNRFGSIDIRTTKTAEDSSLQKLINLVQEAEQHQAPMQRTMDKWAGWLVPIALVIAIATYMATGNITRAVTVLVVFCPCALTLATPTSIMAAIGQATKHGVLIKSGVALETMGQINCIAFDKTGTLTYGTLSISDLVSCNANLTTDTLLSYVATAESRSEHPLGQAIVKHAQDLGTKLLTVDYFHMTPGKGINATLDNGERILCGNVLYLQEFQLEAPSTLLQQAEQLCQQGKAVIFVARDDQVLGLVALSDTIRPVVRDTMTQLKSTGIRTVLLTGDHRQTATHLAQQIGLEDVRAELLPAQKMSCIQELQSSGNKICMIGDGINDAPALKIADVGVAMGSIGSDTALEAADIALMGDDLSKLLYLQRLARATLATIRSNITLSMVLNFTAIGLSIYGLLQPITGALVHNAGSILVVLNATWLYDKKIV